MNLRYGKQYFASEFHKYLIGGNETNAFAIGNIGSKDDFFLIGSEPTEDDGYPLLTGNVLDSEGLLLFRLVRNILVINPGKCSKVLSDGVGYEIHDNAGELIFKVETTYDEEKTSITTIGANFYNKDKELVFNAKLGSERDEIISSCNIVMGFSNGQFDLFEADEDDREMIKIMLSSSGRIYERIKGEITNQKIDLSGKILENVDIHHCEVTVSSGDFKAIGSCEVHDNHIYYSEFVENIINFNDAMRKGNS